MGLHSLASKKRWISCIFIILSSSRVCGNKNERNKRHAQEWNKPPKRVTHRQRIWRVVWPDECQREAPSNAWFLGVKINYTVQGMEDEHGRKHTHTKSLDTIWDKIIIRSPKNTLATARSHPKCLTFCRRAEPREVWDQTKATATLPVYERSPFFKICYKVVGNKLLR